MARIRSLHPNTFTDGDIAAVSLPARFLFLGLWTEADSQGAFAWNPETLRLRILAGDGYDVGALLDELETRGLVRSYSVDGRRYGAVRSFCEDHKPGTSPSGRHPLPRELWRFVELPSWAHTDDGRKNWRAWWREPLPEGPVAAAATRNVTGELLRPPEDSGGIEKNRPDTETDSGIGAVAELIRAAAARFASTWSRRSAAQLVELDMVAARLLREAASCGVDFEASIAALDRLAAECADEAQQDLRGKTKRAIALRTGQMLVGGMSTDLSGRYRDALEARAAGGAA